MRSKGMWLIGLIVASAAGLLVGSGSVHAQLGSIADIVPPTPTPAATASPTPRPGATAKPTATPAASSSDDETLPNTGIDAIYTAGGAGFVLTGISMLKLRRRRR